MFCGSSFMDNWWSTLVTFESFLAYLEKSSLFFCSVENPVWENYGHLCVYIKVQIGLLFHLFYANEWELVFSSKGLRGEGENRFQQEVVGPC